MEKKNDMEENIIVVNNGIVLPSLSDNKGGVCDNDFAFINESKNQGGYIKRGGNYDFDRGGYKIQKIG